MRVLVAEDDQVTSGLICSLLRNAGHSTTTAFDTMQAVMLAMRAPHPDLVVLDLQMPGGTGMEVLRRLKQSIKTNAIPVLVVSGSDDPAAPDQVRGLGASGYVPKPIVGDQLLAEVARLLAPDA